MINSLEKNSEYCVSIPCFDGGLLKLEKMLESFYKFSKESVDVYVIISSYEYDQFNDKLKHLPIKLIFLKDIIKKTIGFDIDEKELLIRFNRKQPIWSLKVMLGTLYLDYEYIYCLADDDLCIKEFKVSNIIKTFKKNKRIFYGTTHIHSTHEMVTRLMPGLSYPGWLYESLEFLFEKEIMKDFASEVFSNITTLEQFYSIFTNFHIFIEKVYGAYIYTNNIKYGYSFIHVEEIYKKYLGDSYNYVETVYKVTGISMLEDMRLIISFGDENINSNLSRLYTDYELHAINVFQNQYQTEFLKKTPGIFKINNVYDGWSRLDGVYLDSWESVPLVIVVD
jgi:hypothetical protein